MSNLPIGNLPEITEIPAGSKIIVETPQGTKIAGAELVVAGNGAAIHNGIYRGKDLTDVYTDAQIHAMIADGSFKDLFVGDYVIKTINTSYGGSERVKFIFAGFDLFLHDGDTETTAHHAVMLPEDSFKTLAAMNGSNTTANGYKGSAMHSTVLPVYAAAIKAAFSNYVLTHREIISNAISTSGASMAGAGFTGYASGWGWEDITLRLMNEVQLYGCTVLSSSFYDVGNANMQFPLFRLNPAKKVAGQGFEGAVSSRYTFWLSAVASATNFCRCSLNGVADYYGASDARGVRPYFLLS